MSAVTTGADLERALQYENHRIVTKHLAEVLKRNAEDKIAKKLLVVLPSLAHDTPNLRVS